MRTLRSPPLRSPPLRSPPEDFGLSGLERPKRARARLHEEECIRSCETQQELFESWEASDERERFADLKRCIKDSECDDIADGECYDEELYIW